MISVLWNYISKKIFYRSKKKKLVCRGTLTPKNNKTLKVNKSAAKIFKEYFKCEKNIFEELDCVTLDEMHDLFYKRICEDDSFLHVWIIVSLDSPLENTTLFRFVIDWLLKSLRLINLIYGSTLLSYQPNYYKSYYSIKKQRPRDKMVVHGYLGRAKRPRQAVSQPLLVGWLYCPDRKFPLNCP